MTSRENSGSSLRPQGRTIRRGVMIRPMETRGDDDDRPDPGVRDAGEASLEAGEQVADLADLRGVRGVEGEEENTERLPLPLLRGVSRCGEMRTCRGELNEARDSSSTIQMRETEERRWRRGREDGDGTGHSSIASPGVCCRWLQGSNLLFLPSRTLPWIFPRCLADWPECDPQHVHARQCLQAAALSLRRHAQLSERRVPPVPHINLDAGFPPDYTIGTPREDSEGAGADGGEGPEAVSQETDTTRAALSHSTPTPGPSRA